MKTIYDPLIMAQNVGSEATPIPVFPLRWLRRLGHGIARAYEVHRQRQALLRLDARMLKDIGVSRADAWREGRLPFWVDSNWRPGE